MTFWSDDKWSILGPQCVEPHDPNALEDANYLLSIGDEIYVSSPQLKSTIQKLTDGQPNFYIEPGQFAFLLSAERVTIPFDAIGFISIRASIKFMGLVNISGFHVDPGYAGKLIFAVFNAGPARIHLQRGQKVFPLWIAALDNRIKRQELKMGYEGIPPKLITQISGDFTTAYQLKTQLDQINEDVVKLKVFRLYLTALLAVVGFVLFPILKERIVDIVSSKPVPTKSESLPPSPPNPDPSKKSP